MGPVVLDLRAVPLVGCVSCVFSYCFRVIILPFPLTKIFSPRLYNVLSTSEAAANSAAVGLSPSVGTSFHFFVVPVGGATVCSVMYTPPTKSI